MKFNDARIREYNILVTMTILQAESGRDNDNLPKMTTSQIPISQKHTDSYNNGNILTYHAYGTIIQ